MMDDYISRQAAIKAVEGLQDCYNGFSDTYDKACIIGALEEVPSAPVREVKRGHLMISPSREGTAHYVCSECNFPIDAADLFCRNCGADMREES